MKRYFATALMALALTGCSSLIDMEFPGVHKMDVQQGNIITDEMVDLLRLGLTRDQVQYVMGTPLVVDTFNDSHWDYVYQLKQGDGSITEARLRVIFVNDRVSEIQH